VRIGNAPIKITLKFIFSQLPEPPVKSTLYTLGVLKICQRVKMKFTKNAAAALLLTGSMALAGGHGTHWGYTGHEGPANWGSLSEEYQMCGLGQNQSPIDITSSVDAKLPAIGFSYGTSPTEIVNNGHTVQVNVADGSRITVDGSRYTLKQYHFHTPSENHIDGKDFPLEAHFVHADEAGNLAVVAVMFVEGAENEELAQLWSKMPMKKGEHNALSGEAKDINDLLPTNRDYYRFNGSLTTPPCSEGVKWMVMKTPLSISRAQVEKFSHAVHGTNNRPVQPHNARLIIK
jgi:carbonic anhydrase